MSAQEYLYAYGGWTALPVGDDYGVLFAVADRHPTRTSTEVMHYRRYAGQSSEDDGAPARSVDVQRPFVFKRVDGDAAPRPATRTSSADARRRRAGSAANAARSAGRS